ncbi:VTT domain-containing protein [[Clostridium] symbiosum]|uniref:DedA family protein n=1 Tax=Clostridium symbiosum TaxID=1512 RepID=UPI001924EBBC|nr:VTT domain-containing protein [[Clostridium] symbiosum]MDB2031140.1 VTT domain-containing protein [[Clostridium] symbiosum]
MSIQMLTRIFLQYGALFIFLLVLLEYMNLPGLPAGIIMPLAGIWASQGKISFVTVMIITVLAGLLGSWLLYLLGRLGGGLFIPWYLKRFPGQRPRIEKYLEMLRKKGAMSVFISKLIPVARTIISIPAGAVKMDFLLYTISSAGGILIWNFVLVGAGYWAGDAALKWFALN